MNWRISSYSCGANNCIEMAADFKVSSYSMATGQCVEVGGGASCVMVRDTKDRERGTLHLAPGAWSAFAAWSAASV